VPDQQVDGDESHRDSEHAGSVSAQDTALSPVIAMATKSIDRDHAPTAPRLRSRARTVQRDHRAREVLKVP